MTNKKEITWNGLNKKRVRNSKLSLCSAAHKEGYLPKRAKVLSFAGAPAFFEKGLVQRNVAVPESIDTVQDCCYKGEEGAHVLDELIKQRDRFLPGMRIWPSSFHNLVEAHKEEKVTSPSIRGRAAPKWHLVERYRKEMNFFEDTKKNQYSILDIDICGIFSPENGSDIANVMYNGMLARRGFLFINHLKGRDYRNGKIFDYLEEYFSFCPYFTPELIVDKETEIRFNFSSKDPFTFDCFRYVLVPIFYICEAFRAGYHLNVIKLLEYCDRNKNNAGVNMLQWFFNFEKRKSEIRRLDRSSNAFKKLLYTELQQLKRSINYVCKMYYPWETYLK